MTTKATILIVEDEPKWSQTYRRLLSSEEVSIEETKSLVEARKLLHSRAVDIVLLDLRLKAWDMSDFTGKELLLDLGKVTEQSGTQVIVISAHLTAEIVREAFKIHNAFDIFDKRDLATNVEEFIQTVKDGIKKAQDLRRKLSNENSEK